MKTKELCIHGLLIALVAVCTMVFQIPVSATQGYVHLGDSMILLVGVFFGARYGMVAGGIGSALADVLSGYSHWAPFTLIIKGLMVRLHPAQAAERNSTQGATCWRLLLALHGWYSATLSAAVF